MSHHYLHFHHVHYRYPDGTEALRGVDFRISHGEKVILMGDNGAGKSTLLLHTNGLLLPTEGEISVGGIPLQKETLELVRRTVGLVFQNPDDQLFMPTVEEDVAFGPRNMKLPPEEVERRVVESLEAVGALHLRQRTGWQLSGGQKRSVAIATVLSMSPDILVMDEPTAGLDRKGRTHVSELIQSFPHTCLIATHDEELVRLVADRIIVMEAGRIISSP